MKTIISVALAIFLIGCSEDSTVSSPQQKMLKQATKMAEPAVVSKEVKEPVTETAPVAVEIADEKSNIVLEETTEVVEVAMAEPAAAKSGTELFKVCSSCHGLNGEKKALNKSEVIQGWSEVQLSTALNGYKDGSYGAAMKGLMKSQVTKLSDEDISVLSKYISEL
ncbi:MAG: c-type cytochrome [Campylobacterota bacterium]